MAMMNENSWNYLQSGLRRVNEDIAYNRLRDSHGQYLSQYPAAKTGSGSPRLPRLSSAGSERSLGGADLRRASYNLVPPVKRSASVESASVEKQNRRQHGVYTPPKYFNNPLDRPKGRQFKKVPNKSISNFLQQQSFLQREAERDVFLQDHSNLPVDPRHPNHNYGSRQRARQRHDHKIPTEWPNTTAAAEKDLDPLPMYRSRNFNRRDKLDIHAMDDLSLAPTPEAEIEAKRKIYLRDKEVGPGSRRSLDTFVEKLKQENERYLREKAVGSSAALQYFPSGDIRNFDGMRPKRVNSPPERDISDEERAINMIVEYLILDVLDEDLIPDLLIETLKELDLATIPPTTQRRKEQLVSSQLQMTETRARMRERDELMHFRAWEEDMLRKRLEFPGHNLANQFKPSHPGGILMTAPVSQRTEYPHLQTNPENIDRTFSSFLEPLLRTVQFDTIMSIVDQTVSEMMPDIVRESLFDVILEDYITSSLLPEVVEEESRNIVMQTLKKYDGRVESKQRKSVNIFAQEKLLDSSSLEHLLTLIAKNGKVFTDDVHKGRILDDVIVTQLLSQYVNVRNQLNLTIRNAPLRRLHERLVTNVACDVILDELREQLDEDLEDLHEYETSIDNPQLLEESLILAATSEAFPEGLKDWIMSVDNVFAADASHTSIDRPHAYNRYALDALIEPTRRNGDGT